MVVIVLVHGAPKDFRDEIISVKEPIGVLRVTGSAFIDG